ncbi:glycosyltransferase [Winogradskyella maritima]|uniref:Glycosyltransferase n=1 Tax=Winogradskyella maritima TaxID=1517766 RepID=A0ABV8AHW2_9FLAO|nr:glycosyltransferase [Winogradskyella maritima]
MLSNLIKRNKHRTYQLSKFILHYFQLYISRLNKHVKFQLKDFKSIPIIIISFNQFSSLKKLIDFLIANGYKNIIVIDNGSSYPPLIEYFQQLDHRVVLHRLNENMGHLCFWKNEAIFKTYSKGYYVVTDPDVVPVFECPNDFLNTFRKMLDKAYDRTKVGFSLKIDDIPVANPNRDKIIKWERGLYSKKINEHAQKAPIDTTFALYRPGYKYRLKDFTKAWRTNFPLQARHCGWYIDINNLTEEQIYYQKTANESASWLTDKKGVLTNETHRNIY